MVALAIFSTNSINILAGVNGLEAGQTFVVACAILTHNLFSVASALKQGGSATYPSVADGHLFSAYLMLPLAACTLALLVYNWYVMDCSAHACRLSDPGAK
jgi:UDP-N-acetylglucosamine--dolichyl-phosphate N-acetylglucosaminephosphotransferase